MLVRKVAATALIAAVLLTMGTASAGYPVVSGRYVGALPNSSFTPTSGPSYTQPSGYANVGGLWMPVPTGASSMDARIVDDSSAVVAGSVKFVIDEYGPTKQSARFCGAVHGLKIPAGAKALYVQVLLRGPFACGASGIPTQGAITVHFG